MANRRKNLDQDPSLIVTPGSTKNTVIWIIWGSLRIMNRHVTVTIITVIWNSFCEFEEWVIWFLFLFWRNKKIIMTIVKIKIMLLYSPFDIITLIIKNIMLDTCWNLSLGRHNLCFGEKSLVTVETIVIVNESIKNKFNAIWLIFNLDVHVRNLRGKATARNLSMVAEARMRPVLRNPTFIT